jgi:hypothetical protein
VVAWRGGAEAGREGEGRCGGGVWILRFEGR